MGFGVRCLPPLEDKALFIPQTQLLISKLVLNGGIFLVTNTLLESVFLFVFINLFLVSFSMAEIVYVSRPLNHW